jgi:hypothetical protein
MNLNLKSPFPACLLLLLLATTATAGPLPTDPNAYLKGSALFSQTLGTTVLTAEVEYAVYAPGQFSASAALNHPVDPTGGVDYVYAYEIFDDPAGNSKVLNLSVGIDYLHRPTAISGGSTVWNAAGPDPPGVAPALSQFVSMNPTHSVKWQYTTTTISTGQHSDLLLYTSPFYAHMFLSSMQGSSSTIASANLPSPVPEPATAALAVIALLCLLAAKCARRRAI